MTDQSPVFPAFFFKLSSFFLCWHIQAVYSHFCQKQQRLAEHNVVVQTASNTDTSEPVLNTLKMRVSRNLRTLEKVCLLSKLLIFFFHESIDNPVFSFDVLLFCFPVSFPPWKRSTFFFTNCIFMNFSEVFPVGNPFLNLLFIFTQWNIFYLNLWHLQALPH